MQEKLPLECNDTAQILAAGTALADSKLFDINDTPAVLVPAGYRIETYPNLRETPVRIEQDIRAATAAAFVAYINLYGRALHSIVFANPAEAAFLAILDYHDSRLLPDWCCHRITYTCPHSKEWGTWSKNSGILWTQTKFVEFIEDNLPDIIEPAGAEMLEIARTLEARSNVRFKSGIRLDNGETQLVYEEVIDGAAGARGQLKIPQTIKLALRVFQGEDPYAVEARFKYRIKEGSLTMWYELVRPHRIIEDSFNGILARIREQLGETPVLEAVPE